MIDSDTRSSLDSGLPVMEHFYTIQGEGYHQGRAAYFIRLAGCDVGCVWCDVKESWDASIYNRYSTSEMVQWVVNSGATLAVITGGEPLLYNLDALTAALQQKGIETNLETSGSHPLTGHWNWICLSPKKFKSPLNEVVPQADELKVVVFNKSDFNWAAKYAAQVKPGCKLYLQPEWSKSETMLPLIIDYIKAHPRWELSVQIHKFIHVP